jgi:hypothetical protein
MTQQIEGGTIGCHYHGKWNQIRYWNKQISKISLISNNKMPRTYQENMHVGNRGNLFS